MSEILVLGGGMNGLAAAILLARDGHRVTVVERDPSEPSAEPDAAWSDWERRGVNQFRMLHLMLPRWRSLMAEECPEVLAELERWGGLRTNLVTEQPVARTGGPRAGDEVFETVTARRPVLEAAIAAIATATPGVAIRRGMGVTGLVTAPDGTGVPRVVGVLTAGGEAWRADLVVDATGRRSPLPAWLDAIGARRPVEEREDSGFIYYGRHFRAVDGHRPEPRCGPLAAYSSVSILTLPADNDTWAVGLVTSARDKALRALRDPDVWNRVAAQYPLSAHWLDGEPLADDVAVMAGIEDRFRSLVVDGAPVVTGLVALGDSWACTNPSLGRGATIGLLHVRLLRDVLRDVGVVHHERFVRTFHERTASEIEPWYRTTLAFDRHRLAEIDADIDGRPYETDDPVWAITKALSAAANADSDALRAFSTIASLQGTPEEVLAQPGLLERVLEVAATLPSYPLPGPDREELVAIVTETSRGSVPAEEVA